MLQSAEWMWIRLQSMYSSHWCSMILCLSMFISISSISRSCLDRLDTGFLPRYGAWLLTCGQRKQTRQTIVFCTTTPPRNLVFVRSCRAHNTVHIRLYILNMNMVLECSFESRTQEYVPNSGRRKWKVQRTLFEISPGCWLEFWLRARCDSKSTRQAWNLKGTAIAAIPPWSLSKTLPEPKWL